MIDSPLKEIMNPKSLVFLGASNNPSTFGTGLLRNVLGGKSYRDISVIHPTEKKVLGREAYRTVSDLPGPVDLAVIVLPAKIVSEKLAECGRNGIKKAIIMSGGFAEVSYIGEKLQREIDSVAKEYNIRFLGPNCLGVCNTNDDFNTTWFPYTHKPGSIGIVSQSGTYMCHTFPYLERLGIGISQAISVGNMADIDIIDILKYLADDPRTEAIALYLEWIRKGREFIEFAKEITRRKPICALYVGGSEAGARASLSHTGALSGTDELYNGVFRQAGIIRAQTLEDLFDWTWALANQPLPKGRRMAILTNSGGPGVSMADACNKAGLEVPLLSEDTQKKIRNFIPSTASPKNPIDLTFMIDLRVSLDELARILLENSEVDGLLIYGIFGLAHLQRVLEISDEKFDVSMEKMGNFMMETITNFTKFPQIYGKPIIGCSFDSQGEKPVVLLQDGNIPFYPTPERAVKAMAALFQYARIRVRQEA